MNERPTPETDQFKVKFKTACGEKYWVPLEHSERLERARDEAREALRELWASADAYLPSLSDETIKRWRKLAGWEEK